MRLFLGLLLAAASMAAAAPPAWSQATDPALIPWYEAEFDTNLQRCKGLQPPIWCADWFEAMDRATLWPDTDKVPEWQTLRFPRNLRVCDSLLPPAWCADWLEAMKAVAASDPFIEIASEMSSEIAAVRERMRQSMISWQEVLARVRSRRMSPKDVAEVRRRAELGDNAALEVLGWMHVKGYGVEMDFAKGYEYYFRAVLRGRNDLLANLDAIWSYLSSPEKARLRAQFNQ